MTKVYDYLEHAKTYYLSTIEGNKPKTRPFGTILLYKDKLYFLTGANKDVSKQMHANPNVEICASLDNTWMRIAASVCLDERIEPKKMMLDAYPFLRSHYSEFDTNTEVWYLEHAKATIYQLDQIKEVISF